MAIPRPGDPYTTRSRVPGSSGRGGPIPFPPRKAWNASEAHAMRCDEYDRGKNEENQRANAWTRQTKRHRIAYVARACACSTMGCSWCPRQATWVVCAQARNPSGSTRYIAFVAYERKTSFLLVRTVSTRKRRVRRAKGERRFIADQVERHATLLPTRDVRIHVHWVAKCKVGPKLTPRAIELVETIYKNKCFARVSCFVAACLRARVNMDGRKEKSFDGEFPGRTCMLWMDLSTSAIHPQLVRDLFPSLSYHVLGFPQSCCSSSPFSGTQNHIVSLFVAWGPPSIGL